MKPLASTLSTRPTHWADQLGTWTSALCVLHCILTPVVLSLSASLTHFMPGEESTHRVLAIFVAAFGSLALVSGIRKHHRKIVLLLMCGGLACITGTAWFGDSLPSHTVEVAITLLGSILMIAAHRLNHTFCRSCVCASAGS